jgi:hypothetical protein
MADAGLDPRSAAQLAFNRCGDAPLLAGDIDPELCRRVEGRAYADLADAHARIGAFIEEICNADRLHSARLWLQPDERRCGQRDQNSPGASRHRTSAMHAR